MYNNRQPFEETSIEHNIQYVGESMEEKLQRVMATNEPIEDVAHKIYTERKEGVRPEFDIRTDRFEIALEATDKLTKTHLAQREERHKTVGEEAKEGMEKEKGGETSSTQGTGDKK